MTLITCHLSSFSTVGKVLPSSVVPDDDESRGDDVEAHTIAPSTQSKGRQPLSTDAVSKDPRLLGLRVFQRCRNFKIFVQATFRNFVRIGTHHFSKISKIVRIHQGHRFSILRHLDSKAQISGIGPNSSVENTKNKRLSSARKKINLVGHTVV